MLLKDLNMYLLRLNKKTNDWIRMNIDEEQMRKK